MFRFISLCLTLYMGLTALSFAQDRFANVEIKTVPVADGIYMLQGAGGNIGISVGDDGVFMIDDQYSPLTPKILAAIAKISPEPIRFLINTHWHQDHTEGNENLGKRDVIIVAHDNVYQRLSTDQFTKALNRDSPAYPKVALPVMSFNDTATFHLNGLDIQARHFKNGHTDGDSIVIFKDKNIIHTGDLFFNGFYPFIDGESGGSIYGMIIATEAILKLTDDQTKIIPGHGPLATKQDFQEFHDMLVEAVTVITPLVKQGLSLSQSKKYDPLKELNKKWDNGHFDADFFLGIIHPMIVDHHQ